MSRTLLSLAVAAAFIPVHMFGAPKTVNSSAKAAVADYEAAKSEQASVSQSANIQESIRKIIDSFFAALAKKEISGAYEQLTKGTFIAEKGEELNQLKTKTRQAIELFGEIQGSEVVRVQNVGSHLVGITCISIGKRLPLRWRFYFYRAEAGWKLIDIRVDDRLVDLFGEIPAPGDQR